MAGGFTDQEAPLAAVCCQGAAEIALYRLRSGEPLGTIPVGEHPVHLTQANGLVFVATMGERSVTCINPDGTVNPVEIGVLGPSHFALAADRLFVTATAGDVVAAIDPSDDCQVERIGVGGEPHELVATDDRLFVGTRRGGSIDVIDPEHLKRVGQVDIGADARIEGIAYSHANDLVYAVEAQREEVIAIEAVDEPHVLARADIGADPSDLVVDSRVFVPGRGDGTLTILEHDLTLAERRTEFSTPVSLVSRDGEYWVIDRTNDQLTSLDGEAIPTPAGAMNAITIPEGILLSHYDDHLLSLVRPETGVLWTAKTGDHPLGTLVI